VESLRVSAPIFLIPVLPRTSAGMSVSVLVRVIRLFGVLDVVLVVIFFCDLLFLCESGEQLKD